jgi:hypothetical protein
MQGTSLLQWILMDVDDQVVLPATAIYPVAVVQGSCLQLLSTVMSP